MTLIQVKGGNRVNKLSKPKKNQEGSAILITTILLLALTVIVATCLSISGMQYDSSMLERNTSNTYYLAQSALEKQVDTMNKALETQMNAIIDQISTEYVSKADSDLVKNGTTISHDISTHKLSVDVTALREIIVDKVYEYLKESYLTKTSSTATIGKNPIMYVVQGDRTESGNYTEIKITTYTTDSSGQDLSSDYKLRIFATATTKTSSIPTTIYDTQSLEAIIAINIPLDLGNQIHEKYVFNQGETPEILKSAILCFSDVVVSGTGQLNVISGDVRVSGMQDIASYNSGKNYPEANQNGGVIALNGGEINIADNLYSTNNVLVTNGWGENYSLPSPRKTLIKVDGDIIAYTVGIVDDYYDKSANQSPFNDSNKVKNAGIEVGRNVMVDNDVMIDRWVKRCNITVAKSIFGINGGADIGTNMESNVNPNQSSGVFAQGEGSQIIAERMYVAGQPYITINSNDKPLKLWESIGEPFNGLASYEGYATNEEKDDNKNYFDIFGDLMSGTKIKTDFLNTYAVAKVSGNNTNASYSGGTGAQVGAICNAVFGNNQSNAIKFFYQGGSTAKFSEFMADDTNDTYGTYTTEVQNIIDNLSSYWGETGVVGYRKELGTAPSSNYRGLRGYMTLMRALFYKVFDSTHPIQATFADNIKIESLPYTTTEANISSWSYETPICVTNGGEIDISNYCVSEDGTTNYQPYPTIIISNGGTSTNPLKLKASANNKFKGIIISRGKVEIESNMDIEGVIIIGGPESRPDSSNGDRKDIFNGMHAGLIVSAATVNILHSPDIITELTVKDHVKYRNILDALYLTDYSKSKLSQIMSKQSTYTQAALKYSNKSILEVNTEGISVEINILKRMQEV